MDRISTSRRSENMRRIKSKNTQPEMTVRRAVHKLGYRYRLHRSDLPGKPDLVFAGMRKAIFVHGCFWHSHDRLGCSDARLPKSNNGYWQPKLARNKDRDQKHLAALKEQGWDTLVVWDCETKDLAALVQRLRTFLRRKP